MASARRRGWPRRCTSPTRRRRCSDRSSSSGYFFFQVPGIIYARRRNASRLIFYALIVWGTLAALTGVIRSFWLLALDRLLLGVAESLIFPAMLLLLTNWFTRSERSRANTLLILGNPVTILWMSAITGFLIRSVRLADDVRDRGTALDCVGRGLDDGGARPARAGIVDERRGECPA